MRTRLRISLVASFAVALVTLPALSWSAPVRIKATANDRWTDGDQQTPEFTHVVPGTRVVWANPERLDQRHDLTAYGGNWSKRVVLAPGEATGKRFRSQGIYKYYCRLHGHRADGECHGMCGVVHVAR